MMRKCLLLLAVIVSLGGVTTASAAEFAVTPNDSVMTILQRQNGNRVTVQLMNGHELTGRIKSISSQLVHLEALDGRDFFDAAVAINKIDAVIVRVKGGSAISETKKP